MIFSLIKIVKHSASHHLIWIVDIPPIDCTEYFNISICYVDGRAINCIVYWWTDTPHQPSHACCIALFIVRLCLVDTGYIVWVSMVTVHFCLFSRVFFTQEAETLNTHVHVHHTQEYMMPCPGLPMIQHGHCMAWHSMACHGMIWWHDMIWHEFAGKNRKASTILLSIT